MIKVTGFDKFFGSNETMAKVTEYNGLYDAELLFDCDPATKYVGGSDMMVGVESLEELNSLLEEYGVVVEIEKPVVVQKEIKESHRAMLLKLQSVMNEMSELCEADDSFNELLGELNESKELFGHSIDEYDLPEFMEEYEAPSFDFEGHTVITNPYYDETLRFEVDPAKYYGLTPEQIEKFNHVKPL